MKIQNSIIVESAVTNMSGFYILAIALTCFFISAITPPFMSPDEVDHIKRAYWLSQGILVLDTPPGANSGEMLDTGLLYYINAYYIPFMSNRNHKLSIGEAQSAATIRWSDTKAFSDSPATSYYFPAAYTPQAFGLWSGRALGLTVEKSYYLARFMVLTAATFILIAAFEIHSPPPLVIALIMLPMTLFQLASASLDGPANALAVLAISLFLKSCVTRASPERAVASLLGITLFILISCRIHLLPMLALPFIAYLFTKARSHLIAGAMTTMAVALWLVTAITHTVDHRVITGATTSSIALYYISDPIAFFRVLYKTLSAPGVAANLKNMFLGVLGWLDAIFAPVVYKILTLLLTLSACTSISVAAVQKNKGICLTLLACSACSVLMTYFSLLITWNLHPATRIEGVQGRYLLIPAIMLAYALFPMQEKRQYPYELLKITTLAALLMYSSYATIKLLIYKYYMQ